MSGISPKQNAFKFKIAPHKQNSIVKIVLAGRRGPLANEALCLSTPKHNGKSGTAFSVLPLTDSDYPFDIFQLFLGTDHLTWRGGLWFFVSFRNFFSDNTRVRIFIFFLSREAWIFIPEFNIGLYDKNSESHYFFFPPPKSEYFFQRHWESEYFFRKKP